MPLRSLLVALALALPGLTACGGSSTEATPAPAPEAASEAPTVAPPETEVEPAAEPWSVVLDQAASTVEWKTIKNGDAPVHGKLTKPSGGLRLTAADLSATRGELQFDLAGVDSGLDLRDHRVAQVFFGAVEGGSSVGTVSLNKLAAETAALEPGGSTLATAELVVKVRQVEATVPAKVKVTRTDANTWNVVTAEDATLSIEALGLSAPLEALMKLCGHKSVDDAVGIAVDLSFKAPE